MALKRYKPTSPGRRHAEHPDVSGLSDVAPEKILVRPIRKTGGRNSQGRITSRWRGGGHKRRYRLIDFARDKDGVPARVVTREYDPNRSAWITLLHYADGEKRYILAPMELEIGARWRRERRRRSESATRCLCPAFHLVRSSIIWSSPPGAAARSLDRPGRRRS